MSMKEAADRERFEAHMVAQQLEVTRLIHPAHSDWDLRDYDSPRVEAMWIGWKAALARAPSPVAIPEGITQPDNRTLSEKLGEEFEERLAAVIHEAHNYGAGENLKHIDDECAEEQAERLRMCVAEMMGFRV